MELLFTFTWYMGGGGGGGLDNCIITALPPGGALECQGHWLLSVQWRHGDVHNGVPVKFKKKRTNHNVGVFSKPS